MTAPTHPCARCGAPVGLEVGLCERCNPLGLSDSASSQVHGTVFLGIVIAVVALAIAGRLIVSGAGPYAVAVTAVQRTDAGLSVTLSVRNEGTAAGSATCRITDPELGANPAAVIRTPRVEGGESRTFAAEVGQFGDAPRPLTVACDAP
jgi:hypothetical protein